MTISNQRIVDYQKLCSERLGVDISFEQAKVEAEHLLRVLTILRVVSNDS